MSLKGRKRHDRFSPAERIAAFWSKVDKQTSCWEWTGALDSSGYGLFRGSDGKLKRAHRFSFELANQRLPAKPYICHHCDNPRCVNPEHLFEGNSRDNKADAIAKGRTYVGGPRRILSLQQIKMARVFWRSGAFTQSRIAEILGLTKSLVNSSIYSNTTIAYDSIT